MKRRIKHTIDSDIDNPAMIACNVFDEIKNEIRNSNLNFQLQMTPFSAKISLKKSLVMEKTGTPRLPPTLANFSDGKLETVSAAFAARNLQLEADLNSLKSDYDRVVGDCSEAFKKMISLEEKLTKLSIKKENNISCEETLDHKVSELSIENEKLRKTVVAQTEHIRELESSLKVKSEISNQLNIKLGEFRTRSETEKAAARKEHKVEIKSWRKELGEERRENIKLKEKLEKIRSEIKECNKKKTVKDTSEASYSGNSRPHLTTSMVSHWNPYTIKTFKRPNSVPSMISHCASHPSPGSSLLSMTEVLEALNKALENLSSGMKWFDSSQ